VFGELFGVCDSKYLHDRSESFKKEFIIYGVLLVIRYLNQHVSSFTSSSMELSSLYVKLCNSIWHWGIVVQFNLTLRFCTIAKTDSAHEHLTVQLRDSTVCCSSCSLEPPVYWLASASRGETTEWFSFHLRPCILGMFTRCYYKLWVGLLASYSLKVACNASHNSKSSKVRKSRWVWE
jgi:hypothetical protein